MSSSAMDPKLFDIAAPSRPLKRGAVPDVIWKLRDCDGLFDVRQALSYPLRANGTILPSAHGLDLFSHTQTQGPTSLDQRKPVIGVA